MAKAKAKASKLNVTVMASSKVVDGGDTTAAANVAHAQTTTTTTLIASSLLVSLALSPLPALALDADGVEAPNIITTIFFTLAVALLAVCTAGIVYLGIREVRSRSTSTSFVVLRVPD